MEITRIFQHFDIDIFIEPDEYDQYPDGVEVNAIVEITNNTKNFLFFVDDEQLKTSEIVDDLREYLERII
jgi:hypothetical protein